MSNTTLSMKKFFQTHKLNIPWCNFRPFSVFHKREWHPAGYTLHSSSWWGQWGLLSTSPLLQIPLIPIPSVAPRKSCFPVPPAALLQSSAHTQATQCPSGNEEPKPKGSIWVQSHNRHVQGHNLFLSPAAMLFLIRPGYHWSSWTPAHTVGTHSASCKAASPHHTAKWARDRTVLLCPALVQPHVKYWAQLWEP